MMQINWKLNSLIHLVKIWILFGNELNFQVEVNLFLIQSNWCISKCHKVNFRRCGSYINSSDWIKDKKATINPKNKDDKSFQDAVKLKYIKMQKYVTLVEK